MDISLVIILSFEKLANKVKIGVKMKKMQTQI